MEAILVIHSEDEWIKLFVFAFPVLFHLVGQVSSCPSSLARLIILMQLMHVLLLLSVCSLLLCFLLWRYLVPFLFLVAMDMHILPEKLSMPYILPQYYLMDCIMQGFIINWYILIDLLLQNISGYCLNLYANEKENNKMHHMKKNRVGSCVISHISCSD